MKFSQDEIDAWRAKLAALPPPPTNRKIFGKSAAVAMMGTELQTLTRSGYSIRELLEFLTAKGLTVHRNTLRKALEPALAKNTAKPPRPRRRPTDPTVKDVPPQTIAGHRQDTVEIGQEEEERLGEVDPGESVKRLLERPAVGLQDGRLQANRPESRAIGIASDTSTPDVAGPESAVGGAGGVPAVTAGAPVRALGAATGHRQGAPEVATRGRPDVPIESNRAISSGSRAGFTPRQDTENI